MNYKALTGVRVLKMVAGAPGLKLPFSRMLGAPANSASKGRCYSLYQASMSDPRVFLRVETNPLVGGPIIVRSCNVDCWFKTLLAQNLGKVS
jgi:hypothetical protein